jgi:hypothetical protein
MNTPDLDQWDKLINILNNLFSIIIFVTGNIIGAYLQRRHARELNEVMEQKRIKEEKEKSLSEIEGILQKHLENFCTKKDIQIITFSANLIKSRISRFCIEYAISLDEINPPLIDFFIISSDGRFDTVALNRASIQLKDNLRRLSSKKAV